MPPSARYLSYLLRLWVTTDAGQTLWRASLECPSGGARRGFASLSELFAFLSAQVAADEDGSPPSARADVPGRQSPPGGSA